jgi:hypothetical protein
MASLMELTLNTTYFNQKCVNRWNYVASGTPAAVTLSFGLMSIMGFLPVTTTLGAGTVGGTLQAMLANDLIFNSAIARAVYIDDDFYDSPFLTNTIGALGGGVNSLSPLDAYGWFSSRVKQSIGRGYKRFPGMVESATESGGVLTSAVLALMQDVSDAMSATLVFSDEGESLTYVPCIVQKEKYVVPDSGKNAYRYYADETVQLAHTAQGINWTAYENQRSQTSRQYGRGQ